MLFRSKNKLINQFKKITREWNIQKSFKIEKGIELADGDSRLMKADLEKYLNSMVNRLPLMQKQVFNFGKIHGLSYGEIATKLNISPLTVKTHMARALNKIRKSLQQYGIGL